MEEDNELRPIYESDGISVWSAQRPVDQIQENLLESGCLGKDKFPTPAACMSAIRAYKKPRLAYYSCGFCGWYHLSSKGGERS